VFQMDVAKVNRDVVYIVMVVNVLQMYVNNVSSVFSDVYCKCVYLDVAYVSHICYMYFI
jgi:hypothetical protein